MVRIPICYFDHRAGYLWSKETQGLKYLKEVEGRIRIKWIPSFSQEIVMHIKKFRHRKKLKEFPAIVLDAFGTTQKGKAVY